MEKRAVRSRGRRARRGRRCVLRTGGALLILCLPVILIGAARRILPGTAEPDRVGYPATVPVDYALSEDQRDTSGAEAGTPWYLTLVNRRNPIPEDYAVHLVEVDGGQQVDERIYEPLMEMLEAAREANLDQLPLVVSGYRTQERQRQLYDERVAKYLVEGCSEEEAKARAEQWVAVPGYSEHQLGFAVDINGASYDVYLWLQENSYRYGFIFRYPGSKTEITGTAEEVWHYRYVGVQAASEMYEQGLCLEEYLENLGAQPAGENNRRRIEP